MMAYSFDGACTNQAEKYFSRLRRAEIGIQHISLARTCSVTLKAHGAKTIAVSRLAIR
ncbi:transposase [Bradyrhizobium arachidis]|uniref:transposase n=1 Tax=Bradyrhizobium arachidis TaxID=858423 RepID=UPI002162FAB7|nr:transposase [Bradyrhizobium arachidis]UVO30400.1 transposase [Bradyrhizobium arachidis]